jgi:hypothetical protein
MSDGDIRLGRILEATERTEARLIVIEQTLARIDRNGCAKGDQHANADKRYAALELWQARQGGATTVISSVASVAGALIVAAVKWLWEGGGK